MSIATPPLAGPAERAAGLRYLGLSIALFGGIWPISRHALEAGATPLWFALNRAGMAALASALLLLALRRLRLPTARDWPAIASIGLLQLGGFFALTHIALGIVPAGRTAILANVTVFWLVPLSVWLLRERVSPRQWMAAGVGLLGVLVLMAPWSLLGGGASLGMLPGYGLLLLASLAWSVSILITRRIPPAQPVLELLPWCFGVATLLILPFALILDPGGGIPPGAWWQAVFVGAIAGPLGTLGTIEAGRRLSGVVASVGFLLVPALGVVLSHVWLGEALGLDILLGGTLIGLSVWLATRG